MNERPPFYVPWLLGIGALLPLWVSAVAMHMEALAEYFPLFSYGFEAFAALLLAFLAGTHWGLAVAYGRHALSRVSTILLLWSHVVLLAAWFALMQLDSVLSLPLLAVGYAVQWLMDRRLHQIYYISIWYMRLRNWLTPPALAAFLLAFLAYA